MLNPNHDPVTLQNCGELIREQKRTEWYSGVSEAKSGNVPRIEDYIVPKELITTQMDVPVIKLDSVALQRIIDEVKNTPLPDVTAYNRVYHRHNR